MLSSYGRLGNNDLEAFQKTYQLKLPDDYKKYLLENNGGSAGNKIICFYAEEIDEPIALGALFGLKQSKDGLSIETWQKACAGDLLENMVVIGKSVFAGLILLVNQEDWKGVYFWDYACLYEDSTEDACMYFVADTFDAFYQGLFIPKKQKGFNIGYERAIALGYVLKDDHVWHHAPNGRSLQEVDAIMHHKFACAGEITDPR